MRPRPATRAASFVNLPPYLSAAEAAERRFWPDSTHEGCCALPVQAANVILRNHDSENQLFAESSSDNLRSASRPTLLTEQVGRRRPQRPGNQHALARVFRCPPIIHPRELPATADSAAIVQQTRKFTFSLDTLCDRTFRAATEKHKSLVQKLWTAKLPCGKPRKTKNELSRTAARVRGRDGSSLFSLLLTGLGAGGGANAAIPGTATRCPPPAGEHIANPHYRFGDVATQIPPTSHTRQCASTFPWRMSARAIKVVAIQVAACPAAAQLKDRGVSVRSSKCCM
jgi:hypothetical protein